MLNLSLFHRELFSFLRRSVQRRTEEEIDPEQHLQWQKLQISLNRGDGSTLHEVIGAYQKIVSQEGSSRLDFQWMNSFREKEFSEAGLLPYFPKIYRGLPRLYHRDSSSRSKIKKNFTNLFTLKSLAVDRALFSLYEGRMRPRVAKIGIVTHISAAEPSNWAFAIEAASTLATRWPFLDLHIFVATSLKLPKEAVDFQVHLFSKDEPCPFLKTMDVLFQIPGIFTEDSLKMEKIGEYGFLESSWFHPKSGHRSMGLHALEKGIFTRKIRQPTFAEIEQKELLNTLFGTEMPGPIEIDRYKQHSRFHFAHLANPVGGAIYLHSLLKMHERDEKEIDLCCPDLHWLIQWLDEQKQFLTYSFGVKEILVLFQKQVHRIPISGKGKTVRIINPSPLSLSDLKRVIALSDDWVAIREDHLLSEAISAKKAFFYDGLSHARYFLKDLTALAENRLSGHRSALHAFRMMNQAFSWNLPEDESEWVDESHFQREERLPWQEIALELGAALQDSDAIVGFKKIATIISEEHSFNTFLCHLVERELFHAEYPEVCKMEQQCVQLYAAGHIPFSLLVKNLKAAIYRQ